MGKRWEEQISVSPMEDDTGYPYQLVKYTMFEDTSTLGKPNDVSELKSRYTIDGQTAQQVGEDKFEIVETGLRVHKI